MRVNVAIPEPHVSAPVLDAALESVTRLNESMIESGAVPIFKKALVERGIRWKPEPPGQEHFDHAALVFQRRHGDCDDLAPWHAASLRATGQDPGARAVVKKSGPKRWHAVVRRSNGAIEDPSKAAGMGQRGMGHRGAVLPSMFISGCEGVNGAFLSPQVALRPIRDARGYPSSWQARADLPWHWRPGASPADRALAALHQSPVSSQALVGACRGIVTLGEESGMMVDHDMDRLSAIADMCEGASWEEVAAEYGYDHAEAASHVVGGFFGSLLKKAKKLAKRGLKLVPDVISFVPGVGPAASMAIKAASPMLQKALRERKHVRPSQRQALPAHAIRPVARGSRIHTPAPMRGAGQAFICYPR